MTRHADALTSDHRHHHQQQQLGRPPQVGGRFAFDDGGAYCGGWAAGKADGHGVCSGPAGQGRYEGAWDRGYETSGTYTWPTGNTYAGQWNQGKRHGLGEETKEKWTYSGEWTHGLKGRYGERESTSSCARYDGTWTSGLQDGYGVETYADGGSYRGQWLQGSRHGFGIRQSVPYGVAVHYRQRTAVGAAVHPSSSSELSVDDDDHAATTSGRPSHRGEGRGGFVLVAWSEFSSSAAGPSTPARSRFRGAVARTLRLRKQLSASEGLTSRVGRQSGRDGSGSRSTSEERESVHTDSCTSFISQDYLRGGGGGSNQNDVSVVETYAGEWKNDKRSGYGVCERTDGIKFEGEWFNNKKNGYGVTTFQNGSVEEGKYRENELITSLPSDKSTSGMFAIRTKRLRQRIDSAVVEANHAAEVALQKTDIAAARMETARAKAEQAKAAAKKAHTDAALARQKAAEFEHIQLDVTVSDGDGQSSVDAATAAASEPEQRQSRSLSIIARALGKGLDARRPSTVAAVFHAATSSLASARWSRRPSAAAAVRPPGGDHRGDDDEVTSWPRRTTSNSVTWKDAAGNSDVTDQPTANRTAHTTPDTRQSAERRRAEEQTKADLRTENHLSSEHTAVMMRPHNDHHHHQQQQQQQQIGDNTSTWPRRHRRNDDSDPDGVTTTTTTTTQRRHVDDDRYNDVAGGRPMYDERVDRLRASSPRRRRRIVRRLQDNDGVEAEEDLDDEERDELRALRSDAGAAAGPAGGMSRLGDRSARPSPRYQPNRVDPSTTADSDSDHSVTTSTPSRRLTLPSIVKYQQAGNPSTAVPPTSTQYRASDARPDVNPTKRDTYVIIDGVRKRVTDDVSDRRYHQSGTASADQWDRTSARATYSQDSSYPDDVAALPNRYALEPVWPPRTTNNPGDDAAAWRATTAGNRGSLPDVFDVPPTLSRQEAHLLSHWRREELRQLREEDDRRGRLAIILSVSLLRDWYSQRKFLLLVLALNVSLAAVFWHLLTTS